MDALTAAVHSMLKENSADLRQLISATDAAVLNRPPAPEANSIAVLVAHAVSATRWLVDAALTGRMDRERYLAGDRAAAFATRGATPADLLAIVDELDQMIARLAEEGPRADYGGMVAFQGAAAEPRTRAWSLVHALEHLREHIGHAQLTGQVLATGKVA